MSEETIASETAETGAPVDDEKKAPWPTDDELALLSSERRRWIGRILPQLEGRVAPKGWQEVGKRFGLGKGKLDRDSALYPCVRDCVLFDYRAGGKTAVERHIEGAVDTAEKFDQQCFVAMLRHRVAFFVPGEKQGAHGYEVQELLCGETLVLAEPNLPPLPEGFVYVARILPFPWFWTTSSTLRVLPRTVVDAFLTHLERELGGEGDWRRDLPTVTPDAWAALILNAFVRSLYEEGRARETVATSSDKGDA
jgi:hypothetical protein